MLIMIVGPLWSRNLRGTDLARRLVLSLLAALLALSVQQFLHPYQAAAATKPITASTPRVVEVSGYNGHNCLLKVGGDVACWSGQGYQSPPKGAGPFTAISAGAVRDCGVQEDRSIVCWGEGRSETISGAFSSVSVGNGFGCGVEVGGAISCWGSNNAGQAPQHLDGPFVGVDAGDSHACAIKTDQSIVCWGSNGTGQAPAVVAGSFTSVSAGQSSTCAVERGGDLTCWGDNGDGQAPRRVTGPFTMVSVGAFLACAVRGNGSAACWGRTLDGSPSPQEVAGSFRSVMTSGFAACAIRTDDLLTCWGDDALMPTAPGVPEADPFVQATEGVPYRHVFTVATTSTVDLSIKEALPAGLTLTREGSGSPSDVFVVSGTPKRGHYRLTVVATNLFGTSRLAVTLVVVPPPGFDVNADGIPDLPVGAPGEDVGKKRDAGRVTVLLGSADGSYGRKGAVDIGQESVGQHSENGDRFGAAIATGEVTGDDYIDLIIGVPGEDRAAGMVVVIQGSAKGLTGAKRTVLRQGSGGAAGAAEKGDGFGSAISVGNGLWVGAPGEDLGKATDAGVVTRFLTAPLRTAGSVQYQQGARKVPGAPEKGDRFGAALAGGGALIGAPGEDVGRIVDAGTVTWQLKYTVSQDSQGIPGKAERGDRFGASVATTTLWITDYSEGKWVQLREIAIGAPGEDIASHWDAGTVLFGLDGALRGHAVFDPIGGGNVLAAQDWTPETGDRFGASLAMFPDGAQLVVGAPGEDVRRTKDAGAVGVLSTYWFCYDVADCYVELNGQDALDQGSSGVPGSVRTGSQFGGSLAVRPGTTGGYVAGAPGESVGGHSGAGAVIVMPASGAAQELHQNSPGVPGSAEKGDRFATIPGP